MSLKTVSVAPGGGGGNGTVTNVSITTANGVSGAVANSTTTPAITLTLGDITPTKVTVTESVGSSALVLTGATQTASFPVLDATQTWSNSSATFTAVKLNVTDTNSAAASLLMDLQVNTSGRFRVSKTGQIVLPYSATTDWVSGNISFGNRYGAPTLQNVNALMNMDSSGNVNTGGGGSYQINSDVILSRKAAANLRFGAADAASPVAQTLSVQSIVAGQTNASAAAYPFTINGSQSTGSGIGGSIIFQTAAANSGGGATVQNTLATAMVIDSVKTVRLGTGYTVATLPAAGTAGRRTYVTDALAPTFLGALTGGGAVVCPVFDNGTAWVSA